MTPEDIDHYLAICRRDDPEAVAACYDIYKDPAYHVSFQLAAAEIGYWLAHRRIEPFFVCIENVIEENGSLIYIHKEPARLQ